MRIFSNAFENNERIPENFTCNGEDINPPLSIEDVPAEALSMVVIVDDPDSPGGNWTHWLLWNIPPDTTEISEASVPEGSTAGINSGGGQGYMGPCPPNGVHHYHIKLFALDTVLNLPGDSTREELEKAMDGHIVEASDLIGLYGQS